MLRTWGYRIQSFVLCRHGNEFLIGFHLLLFFGYRTTNLPSFSHNETTSSWLKKRISPPCQGQFGIHRTASVSGLRSRILPLHCTVSEETKISCRRLAVVNQLLSWWTLGKSSIWKGSVLCKLIDYRCYTGINLIHHDFTGIEKQTAGQ